MNDRARRVRLDEIQKIAEVFREPVAAPDFSSAILSRVDDQRGFLSSRSRALVWAGRGAIACTVALIVLGFTLVSRVSSSTLQVTTEPMPITEMIATVSHQASEQIDALRSSLQPDAPARLGLTTVIASVGPLNAFAKPIGDAMNAVSFVGPPDAGASARYQGSSNSLGGARLTTFGTPGQSVWPPVGLRESMGDRQWFDEDSPLLLGSDFGAAAGPK